MKKKIILMITIFTIVLCSTAFATTVGERWPENFDFMLGNYSVEIEEKLTTDAGIDCSFKNVLLDNENVCLVGEIIIKPGIIVKNISLTAIVLNENKIILKILDVINMKPKENIIKFKYNYPFTVDYKYIIFSTVINVKRAKGKSKLKGV